MAIEKLKRFQFENWNLPIQQIIAENYSFILVNGLLVYGLSKVLWYEGIKRIDISKATVISVGGYPAISLILAFLFLKETLAPLQWAAIALAAAAVVLITWGAGGLPLVALGLTVTWAFYAFLKPCKRFLRGFMFLGLEIYLSSDY